MTNAKTSLSGAENAEEIGAYWDEHDLSDHWDDTAPVDFDVAPRASHTYYAIDSLLSDRLRAVAHQRGVSPETLLNLWVQEKVILSAS